MNFCIVCGFLLQQGSFYKKKNVFFSSSIIVFKIFQHFMKCLT